MLKLISATQFLCDPTVDAVVPDVAVVLFLKIC